MAISLQSASQILGEFGGNAGLQLFAGARHGREWIDPLERAAGVDQPAPPIVSLTLERIS